MPITINDGSVFDVPAQTVINTVNCVGVMGKGLAKECAIRFPEMESIYKDKCRRRVLSPGKLYLYTAGTPWILNFPTKIHWRNPSQIEWIESGLATLRRVYPQMGLTSLNVPQLGCANGGLAWPEVKDLIYLYLDLPDLQVNICLNNL
ncbi:Appr-1-p processing enzyme family protein [Klebsiella phage vB_KvM-Eowyn]|uniref:Appr-1-p processing enzyme family protein n=1 Tax=Klebsiella phage vB_KvM-Eowyn TaxID=2762819 RepID=A0A7R8MJD2_9CAUD|nr:Appr-1-p processing enzyme family protein [Klebsiella phage vB_KvM-Eowyn]CAD5235997.1 Appr-1-p processing enzyme family protein [Klebsiella phage vB_KvM-Eowyn]